jgi:cysteinyl-tRNA synthetase
LLQGSAEEWFQGEPVGRPDVEFQSIKQMIEDRIAERAEAKKNRDFAAADRIRDELKADGIVLEDGPTGTTWRRE